MNGEARPYENSTINTAILLPDYRVKIEYVLTPISGESFSVGLRLAKTTETCATCLLPSDLSAIAFKLAHRDLHEGRGEAVRKPDHKYCHIAVRLCF